MVLAKVPFSTKPGKHPGIETDQTHFSKKGSPIITAAKTAMINAMYAITLSSFNLGTYIPLGAISKDKKVGSSTAVVRLWEMEAMPEPTREKNNRTLILCATTHRTAIYSLGRSRSPVATLPCCSSH